LAKTRVLIVDDSVVLRRGLTAALSRDPDVAVAGSASSGRIALMKIPLLRPDIVALDIDMPGVDGLGALAAIRQAHPQLAVIVLNVPTAEGAAATVEALSLGAKDYVTKPASSDRSDDGMKMLAFELAAKIAPTSQQRRREEGASRSVASTPNSAPADRGGASVSPHRIDVVAIGVSTGGPSALTELLPTFDGDFPVPILIVQHMPASFTKLLAARLASRCRIRVAEAAAGQVLAPGCAWIAPGDFHLAVERDGDAVRMRLLRDAAENSCRPAADVLFRSVADVYGPHALAVVMTGMGRDGLNGCEEVYRQGGQVLVQDKASSVVWGMPGSIVRAGIADRIVPLGAMGAAITERVRHHRQTALAEEPG
jgi:two-component system chemotaxis response regulator CheB